MTNDGYGFDVWDMSVLVLLVRLPRVIPGKRLELGVGREFLRKGAGHTRGQSSELTFMHIGIPADLVKMWLPSAGGVGFLRALQVALSPLGPTEHQGPLSPTASVSTALRSPSSKSPAHI